MEDLSGRQSGPDIPIENVTAALVGDAASKTDALDIAGYVRAVALFLTASQTAPPLTMSVEGEWGSGKSSFMLQLETEISRISESSARIVRFNAWRYEKDEALWAAFALNFVQTLRPKNPLKRLSASLSLLRERLDFEEGQWRIWRSAAMLTALIAVFLVGLVEAGVAAHFQQWTTLWATSVIALGVLSAVIAAGRHAWKTVGSPFEHDLKKYFDSPDYRGNRAFIDAFHADFRKIVKSYVRSGERVYVFIDDLDRCEIGRAADLLQALNLLMSGDKLPIIYVLGIDREIVSAGVAANWATQIAYLYPDAVDPVTKSRMTMRFALDYLEKFVQIPFRVPTPSAAALKRYIDELTGASAQSHPPQSSKSPPIETIWISIGADSERFRDLCGLAAPLLDNNPRRIKQFLNVLRLNAVLAHQRGAFRRSGTRPALTLEQLSRFLAITLRYPAIIAEMRDELGLLASLEDYAVERDIHRKETLYLSLSDVAKAYSSDPKLMSFLQEGDERGRFTDVDFASLLQTVPDLKDRSTAAPPQHETAASPNPEASDDPNSDIAIRDSRERDYDENEQSSGASLTATAAVMNSGAVNTRATAVMASGGQEAGRVGDPNHLTPGMSDDTDEISQSNQRGNSSGVQAT